MNRTIFLILFLLIVPGVSHADDNTHKIIRYAALGDSYTIGTGTTPAQSWPALITKNLRGSGINIALVGNLGRNGWTSQDVLNKELPMLKILSSNVVTLLIGVNDWVQGVPSQIFQQNFHAILEQLIDVVHGPQHILVVTIPDFSVTPTGKKYANGRDISKGIAEFNQIILKESEAAHIKVVDLYPLSQSMGSGFAAQDGLHPSAQGYAQWAQLIEPEFKSLCQPN